MLLALERDIESIAVALLLLHNLFELDDFHLQVSAVRLHFCDLLPHVVNFERNGVVSLKRNDMVSFQQNQVVSLSGFSSSNKSLSSF